MDVSVKQTERKPGQEAVLLKPGVCRGVRQFSHSAVCFTALVILAASVSDALNHFPRHFIRVSSMVRMTSP